MEETFLQPVIIGWKMGYARGLKFNFLVENYIKKG
jgi:hypothetical protein